MGVLRLIFAEILCRPVNFFLSALAIVTASSLFVAGPTLLGGYANATSDELKKFQDEADQLQKETDELLTEMDKKTKRIMRDLGVNLRIVHKDTNMGGLYTDFVAHEFPEEYVNKLAEAQSIETIVHVVAMLQQKMKWNDRTVLLIGTKPVLTQSQKNEEKPHMVKPVKPGTVILGHELAGDLKEGDKVDIEGHQFTIAKIMPEFGGLQDVQLLLDLGDAQKVVGKEGQINQIMALNCKCKGDRLSAIRAELEGVLPDTKVTEFKSQAEARERQRDLVEEKRKQQLAAVETNRKQVEDNRTRMQQTMASLIVVSTPLVVLVSAVFVGLMTWLNVRERRTEIGLLRAIGKRTTYVVTLFLGKSLLLGVIGGSIGCALGYGAARLIGGSMEIDPTYFKPDFLILIATAVGAPLIAAMASYLPTLSAVAQDPAVVLMDS